MIACLKYWILIVFAFGAFVVKARNIGNELDELSSPEILDDQSVVFRLLAPEPRKFVYWGIGWSNQTVMVSK